MADMIDEINKEPEVLSPDAYDKEYDKLWAEANGEELTMAEEDDDEVKEPVADTADEPTEEEVQKMLVLKKKFLKIQ